MIRTTACALDCYDACKIKVTEGMFPKMTGDNEHPAGDGSLCTFLNRSIHNEVRIEKPRVNGVEVTMDEAMHAVYNAFKKEASLLWRGSGNMGVMQEVTNLFLERMNGTLTHGSLCDGAGDAGIVAGRGVNRVLPLEQIKEADTVVIWGRNVTVTNAHIMPFLAEKNIVVIDPVNTVIAKKAECHIQIQPRSDIYLALALVRILVMEDRQDNEWLEKFAPEYKAFFDFICEFKMSSLLGYCGVDLDEVKAMIPYLCDKKVVFLVGTGVQKYTTGDTVLRAIDSLAATLGMFGKKGCGVHYLSNSKLGFDNPFDVVCKTVSKVTTEFSDFDTVFIQGGNPAESMPDSTRVCKSLEKVENLIYFGLYENETSKRANIVIPAKNFFEKEDVRLSYGHHYVEKMNKIVDSHIGISEYAFTQYLFDAFRLKGLESEEHYIRVWLNQCKKEDGNYVSAGYEDIPYAQGFGKGGNEPFIFINKLDDSFFYSADVDKRFYFLSSKTSKALNTQFKRDTKIQIHPKVGYLEGDKVKISSNYGVVELEVVLNEHIRSNCVLVTSNTLGVNFLTPTMQSNEGENACYQEVKIQIEKIQG